MAENTIDCSKQEINKFNETYLPDANGATFKSVPSEVLFKKYFSDLQDNYLRIIVGTDSGLLVNYINNTNHDRNVANIFIDHPEVVEYVNTHYSYDHDKIKLLSFEDDIETFVKQNFPIFYITAELYLSKALCVIDSNADYENRFDDVLDEFNDFVAKRNYELPDNIFTDINIKVQAFLDNSLAVLEKSVKNTPALILGGGPTLDENIDWIKEHQEKFIIVAVARISHRLAEEGVTPDAIVTIDPSELSFSNSKETLSLSHKSLLVSSIHPNYKLAGQWQGKSVFMGERLQIPSVNNPPQIVPRGNTVSNFAAQFAMVIGCRDIYLAGVDFCYLASGQSHEGKSLESQTGVSSNISSQIENYAGQIVGTRPNFKLARDSFDYMIADFKSAFDDLKVYSLSEKSAYMKHIECISPEKINLATYKENNKASFQEVLDKNLLNDSKALIKDLESRKKEVQKLIKKMEKAQSYIDKKMGQLNPEWTDLHFINQQLEQMVNKVREILSDPLLERLKVYGYKELIKSLKEDPKSAKENKNILELDRISYLSLINKTMGSLIDKLKEAETHINIRTAEAKNSSSPETLMNYWMENDLPGRIFIWKNDYPELYDRLKSKNPELYEQSIQAYKTQFESSQNVQRDLEKKSKSSDYFLKTINEYKTQGRLELLKGLKEQISKTLTSSNQDLEHYIDATICYLEKAPTRALELINEINNKGIIQFNALQLQLSISMDSQEHQLTLETLLSLCEYSPTYMPKYAAFLQLFGNAKAAIEIYKMYLGIVPNDTESIVKCYHLIAQEFSEEEALAFIKQKHDELPNNSTIESIVNSI